MYSLLTTLSICTIKMSLIVYGLLTVNHVYNDPIKMAATANFKVVNHSNRH